MKKKDKKQMKNIFIISISAILGMFTQIDSSYAAGGCGIGSLDTSTKGTIYGWTRLNGNAGSNESNYGLTTGSGQWASEFSYGTVWGMAKCSETSGNHSSETWPESSKSDWLKTPSDTTDGYCWCQATGFTASGNSYTSGPQCTTTASSLWVYVHDHGSYDGCAGGCASLCASSVRYFAALRAGVYGVAGVVPVGLAWYDNGTTISGGPSFCAVGGTFVPPTPPARPGYVFNGWHLKTKCGINQLSSGTKGSANGYSRLSGSAGSSESNYGLTRGSGQWATQFSYGTVWGMAKCSETAGDNSAGTWSESSKSNWLKTPSDTVGKYCWCQATGFTASGNSYTSGPQCTADASSKWVFLYTYGSSSNCTASCAYNCSYYGRNTANYRKAIFGAVGQ